MPERELDEGLYRANLLEGDVTTSRKGDGMMVLKFSVTHRIIGNNQKDIGPGPVIAKVYLMLTEKSKEFTNAQLDRFGFSGDLEFPTFAHGEDVVLAMEQGKFGPSWNLAKAPPSPEKMAELAKMFGDPSRQGSTPKPAAKGAAAPAGGDDSGLPF